MVEIINTVLSLLQNRLFNTLLLLISFYAVLKSVVTYNKSHDNRSLILAALFIFLAFEAWSRVYETNVKAFFEKFRILLVLFPIVIFLVYSTIEKKRHAQEKEKQVIKGAFQQYLAPSVIDELLKNPDKLKLGGEKKELTIFFSDIRGFTTLSEKLTPEQLVQLLNEYLSEMTDIVLKKNGLVDKYIGDAIMAFWGAPLDNPKHAESAAETVIEMKRKLEELQKNWKTRGMPVVNIGVGLNTGNVIVGNMGSKQRFDYTVMGDTVNLASRLEGTTKEYGVLSIVSESTYDKIKDKGFVCRELDFIKVKGKNKPIKIFELIEKEDQINTVDRKFIKTFEEGLNDYRSRKWDAALKNFEAALKMKDDLSSKNFIDRCKEYKKNPPPKDWDGSFTMTHK